MNNSVIKHMNVNTQNCAQHVSGHRPGRHYRRPGNRPLVLALSILCTLLQFAGFARADTDSGAAELVLLSGRIYTVDTAQPWVEALAIKDGKILAAGSNSDISAYRRDGTRTIDLQGKMVMPGIIDAHLHPVSGSIKALFECNFPFTASPEDIASAISQCAQDQPDSDWIIGGQWTSDFFVNNPMDSPRRWLDKAATDKAVILTDDSGHNHWANSRALQLMGINADSADPAGGKIGREANSSIPNGILEEAYILVANARPEWTPEQYQSAAAYAVKTANSYGVTGMKDASAKLANITAFKQLDHDGQLTANIAAALNLGESGALSKGDIAEYVRRRDRFGSPHLYTSFVKIFLDGVPTASRSAAMLQPYLPVHGDEPGGDGSLHLSPDQLSDALISLDKLGFTVKIHTAGDRSVRVTLDAIAMARKANGDSGLHHELAHAGFIADSDLPRFASLGVVADFSPYIWFPSPIIDSVIGAVGERGKRYWPTRDLLDHGVAILAGSDWPSAVPDMNPWTGMEALVTRRNPTGDYPGELWPEQAITVEEAIAIYTLGGARALKLEEQTGSLKKGKSADFIVLNNNLLEIPADAIGDTRVQMTFFEGELVYQAPDA